MCQAEKWSIYQLALSCKKNRLYAQTSWASVSYLILNSFVRTHTHSLNLFTVTWSTLVSVWWKKILDKCLQSLFLKVSVFWNSEPHVSQKIQFYLIYSLDFHFCLPLETWEELRWWAIELKQRQKDTTPPPRSKRLSIRMAFTFIPLKLSWHWRIWTNLGGKWWVWVF